MKHCTVLPIKDQRLCMSEVSKVAFVAFTQQCIWSNLTHVTQVRGVKGVKYCTLYTLAPHSSEIEGCLKSLPSCGFSSSPQVSLRRQLF